MSDRQPADQVKVRCNETNNHVLLIIKKAIFNLKFSRKVVSSYKKEANKLKMKPH